MSNDNAQVAHLWAAHNLGTTDKQFARSSNGNMSYSGDTLYSYSTAIGRFVRTPGTGPRPAYVLVSTHAYSKTTVGKHYNARFRALHGLDVPMVPVPILNTYDPDKIITALLSEAEELQAKGRHSRKYAHHYLDDANARYSSACVVAEAHGLPSDNLAEHAARLNREREGRLVWQRMGEFFAEYNAAAAEMFERPLRALLEISAGVAWLAGDRHYAYRYDAPTLLRVNGDTVETSRGAEFPLEHGLKALPFIKLAQRAGGAYALSNGPHLGHFRVDEVTADGTVRAGCHTVPLFAIRWAARNAGACDAPELDHVAAHVDALLSGRPGFQVTDAADIGLSE